MFNDLESRGVSFSYESEKITYEIPVSTHKYTPDFVIALGSGATVYIETKGYFPSEDRTKYLRVRASNPDIDLRFVFDRATEKIRKGSKTTYGDWCRKNGFKFAEKKVPEEWLTEGTSSPPS